MTYPLPRGLIAQYPAEPRDAARLMVLDRLNGQPSHHIFRDLPGFLHPGDCLVLNDTKVLRARLFGRRADSGGKVELLLLDRYDVPKAGCAVWRCLAQPARRLKAGVKLLFDHGSLSGEVEGGAGAERTIRFEGNVSDEAWERIGLVPLPPYIDRPVQAEDDHWYQTVYARQPGAVAAPTAGLHFTAELLSAIRARGVRIAFITLHVGWGTFKPVREEELAAGRLHPERFRIPAETLQAIQETKAKGGRVVAVGTTVVRALETEAKNQRGLTPKNPLGSDPRWSSTDLFIRPGFGFRVADALITNFHLPGTSLLLLVAAFAGEDRVIAAYQEAVRRRYRFYSYGDAMLILRGDPCHD